MALGHHPQWSQTKPKLRGARFNQVKLPTQTTLAYLLRMEGSLTSNLIDHLRISLFYEVHFINSEIIVAFKFQDFSPIVGC